METPVYPYATKTLKIFAPGKPLKPTASEPIRTFLDLRDLPVLNQRDALQTSWTNNSWTTNSWTMYWISSKAGIAVLLTCATALAGIFCVWFYKSGDGLFAQPGKPPYTTGVSGMESFVPLHITSPATMGSGADSGRTSGITNYAYIQTGSPTIVIDKQNY